MISLSSLVLSRSVMLRVVALRLVLSRSVPSRLVGLFVVARAACTLFHCFRLASKGCLGGAGCQMTKNKKKLKGKRKKTGETQGLTILHYHKYTVVYVAI